jgi:hypothetical protein
MGSEIDPGGDTSLVRGSVSFCSSVGVSAMPMCPRLADGHIKRPRSALFILA